MGNLYIVATPIGNLQDISLRAVEILKKVDFILCEDTRKTSFLLEKILGHKVPKEKLASYYEQNEIQRIPGVIELLKAGYNLALVSDAGTPLVSDPGFKLVREVRTQNIKVESIPGPSASISALSISGLPTDKFLFIGYLPKKPGNRSKLLNQIKLTTEIIQPTVILYEAPHRLVKTLEELLKIFGDIDIVMCREMTKIHEEYRKDKISKLVASYQKSNPKGEIVLLFNLKD
ncbi:16S rRNA (cytidine(1402)-2'-O)-methyltransferase [Patescibacteria group bacterium]|nr:16S rRNA (cytidine(1402)-2'-O)-methyltransferase [Patescibacteria group bacterium]